MRKQVLLLLVVLLSLTSCGDSWFGDKNSKPGQEEAISGALTGKWRVVLARVEGEEDITDLYGGYVIEFTQDGQYIITNPTGAPNPNPSVLNTGLWSANADNSITLDATVLVRIIDGVSSDRVKFSWTRNRIDKGVLVYYWELVRA